MQRTCFLPPSLGVDQVPIPPRKRTMESPRDDADLASPEPAATTPQSQSKRRKPRKGATSCWYCKKRKVKCTFDRLSETVCIACRRRGTPCVGQDQPEQALAAHDETPSHVLLDRMQRVESLLVQLLEASQNAGRGYTSSANEFATQGRSDNFTPAGEYRLRDSAEPPEEPEVHVTQSTSVGYATDDGGQLAEDLNKAFPSREYIRIFCKKDGLGIFYYHQMLVISNDRSDDEASSLLNELVKIPDPATTPPAVMAKQMIILALFLQYFRTQHSYNLGEDPDTVRDRLVETAARLVTSNEKLLSCVEGLESMILEVVFRTNAGNLRGAWVACRKAMAVAQLLRIDHPDAPPVKAFATGTTANTAALWFRMVCMDSFLSLMLGLPHSGQGAEIEHDVPGETPSYKLKRAHALIARSIGDRNRRHPGIQNTNFVQSIDRELLNAARSLPDSYWLPPNFSVLRPNTPEAVLETARVCNHLHHYNLVHLLHLSYVLRPDEQCGDYIYAKITCVNACREILRCFISLRDFHQGTINSYCRTTEIITFLAAMTIMLAHIDGHKLEFDDWRCHQRLGDRAMVEQLQGALKDVGDQTNDGLTRTSAQQLHYLLDVESRSANGFGPSAEDTLHSLEGSSAEHLSIPYYGIIKLGCKGTNVYAAMASKPQQISTKIADSVQVADRVFPATGFGQLLSEDPQAAACIPVPDTHMTQESQLDLTGLEVGTGLDPLQYTHLGMAPSRNDWTLQDVEGAFNSLVRGTRDQA
ncbi:Transcription factor [Fusarium albosuccineum]|uniref:Transcription factor n=1 Tax=Fusarium albosuccineum TaxID=1237068 RepID=A0A8H4PCM8_9HYPO|nr:Transcription factor [Fusarium albosuccineum]